ncbi:MAG TPA: DUF488 domain-containing protein [Xanthobacteraceae bacterium]|nr:DUF488 domain-containing protein [Xanthobacteraceae bacterium]
MSQSTATAPLFTIGYEQATSAAVLDELAGVGIGLLVDVRAVAASRRPGFSKRQLGAALDERGIRYLHLRALGTPTEGRVAARSGRPADMFRIYEAHLATPGAGEELDALALLVQSGQRVCLLCYERDPAHCHRRRVAELMQERAGVAVEHLFARQV